MKKIFVISTGLLLISTSLFGGSGLEATLNSQISSNMSWVFTMMKLFGFAIIIWGVTDLISENQQQQNAGGSKYIKAVMKIMVGGILIAGKTIYDAIK